MADGTILYEAQESLFCCYVDYVLCEAHSITEKETSIREKIVAILYMLSAGMD